MAEGPRKIGFVIPWYSDTMGGGAETACRMLAKMLQGAGAAVEVLTTQVKDFRSDWSKNHYARGVSSEGGIAVRRFPAARFPEARGEGSRFHKINARLIAGEKIGEEEERFFLRGAVDSPELYEYLGANKGAYIFAFLPYLFGTTYWGVRACAESAVLIPCLHDEGYARMAATGETVRAARGVIFLSSAERELARKLYGDFRDLGVLGLPLESGEGEGGDGARFTRKYGRENFLLYAGRTDEGKNAELLVGFFVRYIEETGSDLQLLFMGVKHPPGLGWRPDRIHALGFLSERDKRDCFAAALALCVPSVMESFSIVMMESWLAGRPAIANERCAVTSAFCRESNGGLWFADYEDFRGVVKFLEADREKAAAMGESGRAFVKRNFQPEHVARKYLDALTAAGGEGTALVRDLFARDERGAR